MYDTGWCFAIVNGKLAEIYFDKKRGVWGHCYVKRDEFNKRENRQIDTDIKKYLFSYRNRHYVDKINGINTKT